MCIYKLNAKLSAGLKHLKICSNVIWISKKLWIRGYNSQLFISKMHQSSVHHNVQEIVISLEALTSVFYSFLFLIRILLLAAYVLHTCKYIRKARKLFVFLVHKLGQFILK